MQPVLMFGLLMAAFLVFACIGVPVFFAMGLAAMTFILAGGEVPLNLMATALVQGIDSFAFLAIPFFFLAGDLMNTGGITRRLLAFAAALVGHIRGGLSHVAILGTMVFSGVFPIDSADYEDLQLTLYADGAPWLTRAVTSATEFVLPDRLAQASLEIELAGTSRVQSVEVAEEMEELE